MVDYTTVNIIIILGILIVMLGLYLSANAGVGPEAIRYPSYPSTASAFYLFSGTFLCFLIFYLMQQTAPNSLHRVANLTISNLASACTLAAAVAYARGNAFDMRSAALSIGVCGFATFLWAAIFEYVVKQPQNLFFNALESSPQIILSAVARIALGWVFFARWGLASAAFLLVSAAYAFVELPGYLEEVVEIKNTPELNLSEELTLAFPLLAGGKILLAFVFVSLLCSSTIPAVDINNPKIWPTGSVTPPFLRNHVSGWVLSVISGVLIAILTDPLKMLLQNWLFNR